MLRRSTVGVIASAVFLVATQGMTHAEAAPLQTARSQDGLFASATISDALFPDGSTRALSVSLVIPRGAVTGTEALASLDVTRAWAVFGEFIVSDPATNNTTSGDAVCSLAANPTRFSEGSLGPRGDSWDGTSVDVSCGDDSGYDFYRVRWNPRTRLITNQVTTNWGGSQLTNWSAANARGTLEMVPTADQQSVVSICGFRSGSADQDAGFDCFDGWGRVVPSVDGMTVHAAAV